MWTEVFEEMNGGVKGYLKELGFNNDDMETMQKNLAKPAAS